MMLISWNVKHQGLRARVPTVLAALERTRPDLVTLQEVARDAVANMFAGFARIGLPYSVCTVLPTGLRYGNLIASRSPIEPSTEPWVLGVPFPELIARATVATPNGSLDLITAHAPNGSKHRWKKIETMEALARGLRSLRSDPRVLTGDFNTPQAEAADGTVTYWDEGDERWLNGERSIIGGQAQHGLRDVFRAKHGYAAKPVSHYTRGTARRYDHIFASDSLVTDSVGYFEDWMTNRWSDHAAMWARFKVR